MLNGTESEFWDRNSVQKCSYKGPVSLKSPHSILDTDWAQRQSLNFAVCRGGNCSTERFYVWSQSPIYGWPGILLFFWGTNNILNPHYNWTHKEQLSVGQTFQSFYLVANPEEFRESVDPSPQSRGTCGERTLSWKHERWLRTCNKSRSLIF